MGISRGQHSEDQTHVNVAGAESTVFLFFKDEIIPHTQRFSCGSRGVLEDLERQGGPDERSLRGNLLLFALYFCWEAM